MTRIGLIPAILAAAIFCGCGRERAADTTEAPAATPAGAGGSRQLLAMLPAANEIQGWTVSRTPRSFTPDNLWELIDGAADGFLAYGVQEVVTAEYKLAGTDGAAVVEIYQMKDPLNAYGKYAEERYADYRFLDVGNEGYSGGTSLNFWKGAYYVKITALQQKGAVEQEMVNVARSIARKISVPGAEPPELTWLPKENQLPHTTRYLAKDVLGQSYFTNGFEARYAGGAKESKVVLIVLDSPAAAQDAFARYRQSVARDGKTVRDLAGPGDGGFAGKDSYYGNLAAVRGGKHIVVSLGAAGEGAAMKQLAEVIGHIK